MPAADEKPTAEDVAKQKVEKPAENDVKFTVERLLQEPHAVGHPAHVVRGAFSGVADSKEVTINQAKDRIAKWLKAEVKTDTPEA